MSYQTLLISESQVSFPDKFELTTAADDNHKYFHCFFFFVLFFFFSEKIRLDVSSESSARQRVHMKNQASFSSKDKDKKCRLLQFLAP